MFFVQLRIAPQNPKTPSRLIINSMGQKKVLITGLSGLIGLQVVKTFA